MNMQRHETLPNHELSRESVQKRQIVEYDRSDGRSRDLLSTTVPGDVVEGKDR